MSEEKKPFHEVASKELSRLSSTIKEGDFDFYDVVFRARVILEILRKSKMKAVDAHQLALDHAGLPETLRFFAKRYDYAVLAEEVLTDLRGRVDEKKEGKKPDLALDSEAALHQL